VQHRLFTGRPHYSQCRPNEDTILQFSASGRTIHLVSGKVWRGKVYPDIRMGSPPAGALK